MRNKFTYILLLLFAVGCSYSVDMVKPEKIATSYKGKVLPATMNLYLSEELKSKIWEGHPSSFAGSVHTFQVPLGNVVAGASKKTFQSLFKKLNHLTASVINPPILLPGGSSNASESFVGDLMYAGCWLLD